MLAAGTTVRIFGLQEMVEYNGRQGILMRPEKDRDDDGWVVALEGSRAEVKVLDCNLIHAADYDSDEEYCVKQKAKRQRLHQPQHNHQLQLQPPPPRSSDERQEGVVWQVLSSYRFPAGCACADNLPVYKAFKSLEKYELAVQCDDFSDSELRKFNSEALLYGRSAAVVAGLPSSLTRDLATSGSKAAFTQRLVALPFFGPFRAAQVHEILTTGSCEALCKFEAGLPPTASDGALRLTNDASRSLRHAPAKKALGKVFGMGIKTAIDLVESSGRFEGLPPIASVAALRASPQHLARLRADSASRDGALTASLAYYDELQEDCTEAEAEAMRRAVRSVVRRQHSLRVGTVCDCPDPPGDLPAAASDLCKCCWHVEFTGGARTRGVAGHDVDLLVWHHSEANSWGEEPSQCVLRPLLDELLLTGEEVEGDGRGDGRTLTASSSSSTGAMIESVERGDGSAATVSTGSCEHHQPQARAGLLPRRFGRCQVTRRSHAEKQRRHVDGARAYLVPKPSMQGGAKGYENLQGDWHDKVMGIWRDVHGKHRRIDIVIVSRPEELPFARLTWTGSRTLNRLLRHRAIHLGLHLTANGLVARPPNGVDETRVVLDNRPGRGRGHAAGGASAAEVAVVLRGNGQVPPEATQNEEAIIRILANGTDAFAALYDPRMRNA